MLTDRIIGAFTFRKEVYKEVERDATFTNTAWVLVIVVAFLNQLGSQVSENLGHWVLGAAVGLSVAHALKWAFPGLPVETPVEYVGLALAVSVIVGLASGVLPARRAAALDPVEALSAD